MKEPDILEQIDNQYEEYIEEWENGLGEKFDFDSQSDTNKHHQREVQKRSKNRFDILSPIEREYLIIHSDEIPDFHNLSYQTLVQLPSRLTNIGKIQYSLEHRCYWGWTFKALQNISSYDRIFDYEVQDSLYSLGHLALTGINKPKNTEAEKVERIKQIVMDSDLQKVSDQSDLIAAFVSYPILEGLLKNIASDVVKPNGVIRPGERLIGMREYAENDQCNRIGDFLHHCMEVEFEGSVAEELSKIEGHVRDYDSSYDSGFKIIADWRNTLLHGESTYDITFGILMNIISLIIWREIGEVRYKENHDEMLQRLEREQQRSGGRAKPAFYPP